MTLPNSIIEIEEDAFNMCTGLTSITLPNSLTTIGEEAFKDCSGLTNVNFGNSVASIGDNAFGECTELTSATCLPTTPPTIYYDTFGCTGIDSNATLFVPAESVTAYQTAKYWKEFYSILPISDQPTVEPGDVDGNGTVGITDVTVLIDFILNGDTEGINLAAADVDGDGKVNISDVTFLIDFILNGSW